MEKIAPSWTLGELAEILGGTVASHPHYIVKRPVPADSDDPDGIAFCESEPYLAKAHASGVGALILPYNLRSSLKPAIHVEYPRLAFGKLLTIVQRPLPLNLGVHPTAVVHPDASISDSAQIGPCVVVEQGAYVGDNTRIYPNCYIGESCRVGAGSVLYPNVVLYQDVTVGERCIIHSGAVIGADGFGFTWDGTRQFKVPQVGGVEIGDEVEVGANTTIDRATAGATKIGSGTKLDNLVQVAHNVHFGRDGVMAGQSGIAGSARVGDRATIGGVVAISDHVTITDDVTLGGGTGVASDILEKGAYFGRPALPAREGLRAFMMVPKLPDFLSRIRALEKKVKELEEKGS